MLPTTVNTINVVKQGYRLLKDPTVSSDYFYQAKNNANTLGVNYR